MDGIEATADSGQESIDIESVSDNLAADLFPSDDTSEKPDAIDASDDVVEETPAVEETSVVEAKAAPKTWPKEMHEHWGKVPVEVQNYWETREKQMLDGLEQYKESANYGKQMRDAVTPYAQLIQAQGIDAPRAVNILLGAHAKLTYGSAEEKTAYFKDLAKNYGINLGETAQSEQVEIDPVVKQLQNELNSIKQVLHGSAQAQTNAERERIGKEVTSFASDPAHPYFDEVADDIVVMLKSGASLQDAYDKAVWANPATRAKEMGRLQQEQADELRKKSLEKAEAAKKAASVNIHNRDTRRTPTEAKRATMRNLDDALQESMREIRSTTH